MGCVHLGLGLRIALTILSGHVLTSGKINVCMTHAANITASRIPNPNVSSTRALLPCLVVGSLNLEFHLPCLPTVPAPKHPKTSWSTPRKGSSVGENHRAPWLRWTDPPPSQVLNFFLLSSIPRQPHLSQQKVLLFMPLALPMLPLLSRRI